MIRPLTWGRGGDVPYGDEVLLAGVQGGCVALYLSDPDLTLAGVAEGPGPEPGHAAGLGAAVTGAGGAAIAGLPGTAWGSGLRQGGSPHDADRSGVAELTRLNGRKGWPAGMRLTVRRVRPAGRRLHSLTGFGKKTGWKYSTVATSITGLWGIAGPHQIQWTDALHRRHAVVGDRVRTDKAMGLHSPFSWRSAVSL
ncbi:hypothetical protein ABT187_49975 [Streptomyces sp. NPDC001817]|uniref:hypothetical protein n=1 Tax=Streptomyces sp. NPDC001817 TaxID=3154398 RepID=UPI0033220929